MHAPQSESSPADQRTACLTLDLEPDCGGRRQSFDTLDRMDTVAELAVSLDVPLTVFVAGIILERRPDVVERIQKLPAVEFGLHGHTHDLRITDRVADAAAGIRAFRSFFGSIPAGYRAPQGRISATDLGYLREQGVAYDSSIFPTYRPGVFNNLRFPNQPFLHRESRMLEIPITALRPFPIPLGLGYLRLMGPRTAPAVVRRARLPASVVVAFHVHDLVTTAHVETLGPSHRWFFRRNISHGGKLLAGAVDFLKDKGYRFERMADTAARATTGRLVEA